ncbi:hypothetical protein D3C81_1925320 [compost metagenome]
MSGAVTVMKPVVLLAGTVMTVVPSLSVKVSAECLSIGRPSLLVRVMVYVITPPSVTEGVAVSLATTSSVVSVTLTEAASPNCRFSKARPSTSTADLIPSSISPASL